MIRKGGASQPTRQRLCQHHRESRCGRALILHSQCVLHLRTKRGCLTTDFVHCHSGESIGKAKIRLRVDLSGAKRDRVGCDAGQVIAGSATDGHGVNTRRQIGKVIEAIERNRGRYHAIGIGQCHRHTINGLLLIRLLNAVTVGIQIDKVADRTKGLENNGVVGLVVTRDGIANGVGVGCVGNYAGGSGSRTDRDGGARLWQ